MRASRYLASALTTQRPMPNLPRCQGVHQALFGLWKACLNNSCVQEQRLPFPLLTDQSEFLRKSFGIKKDFGLLPGRQSALWPLVIFCHEKRTQYSLLSHCAAFVIDKSGKVLLSFNDQLGAEKHVKEALAVLNL